MDISKSAFLILGVIIGISSTYVVDYPDSNFENSGIESSNQNNEASLDATIRNIKQNPKEFEGKTVTLTGKSNSLKDFIANGGYQLDMDCSKYPDFEYSSKFKADFVVEYIPGELGPKVRCVSAPKKISK